MKLVVDTSIWSLVLRRRHVDEADPHVIAFRKCLEHDFSLHLLGNILQELLDGVRTQKDFKQLIKILKPFPLIELNRETYIEASTLRNHCRKKGIQASPIDFLIAASCIEKGYPLLTADQDFSRIARHSELMLLKI